ncbi:eIF4-gamma/eIF5/eIF2-epsilon domain containing protein [Nitzschia inconspicua]|uniref:EIF4-gamma/eIF5/eIF2-epsilon domain containing protein n=1 Tax=Nitzschia inconspicua TaxID=303405 RepID=A0A9K3LW11_9STRA|nr:eIF4-gamma/eIF5/eIF2-epsilon domain containing protein [Nitzschia inconspicua]
MNDFDEVAAKLQAVVLADAVFGIKEEATDQDVHHHNTTSYGLKPLSNESPQILCPLNNLPLIEYIMEFLLFNGVDQVILVTNNETTEIEDYLNHRQRQRQQQQGSSKAKETQSNQKTTTTTTNSSSFHWDDHGGHLELLLLKDTSLMNAGDALRELYKRNWIRSGNNKNMKPFILMQGNVVANLDLSCVMQAHQKRAQQDATAMFTCILKPISDTTGIVPPTTDLVVGLVAESSNNNINNNNAAVAAAGDVAMGSSSTAHANSSSTTTTTAAAAVMDCDYRVFVYDNYATKTNATIPCSFVQQSQSPSPNNTNNYGNNKGGLTIRQDLMDTGIYICSPDVLGRFEDEFDYLDIAQDFIANSVAEEEEGLQTRIYAHVLTPSPSLLSSTSPTNDGSSIDCNRLYAARAMDFASYHAISQDLLQRWAYPVVPDSHVRTTTLLFLSSSSSSNKWTEQKQVVQQLYKLTIDHNAPRRLYHNQHHQHHHHHNKENMPWNSTHVTKYQYKESRHPTKVGRSSICQGPGMVGSHGSFREDCCILQSVVGNNVKVGNQCHIINSHLWDNVVVEDNVSIESSVIAMDCLIKSGAFIPRGCVIGKGCVIGTNVKLKPFTRITMVAEDEDDPFGYDDDFGDIAPTATGPSNSSSDDAVIDTALVGPDGKGHEWVPPGLDDDDEVEEEEGSDTDGEEKSQVEKLPKETWIQLQSIGATPTEYLQWRQKVQVLAATYQDQELDGFSDNEDDNDDFGFDGVTESEAFTAYTDGAFTFGEESSTPIVPLNTATFGVDANNVVGRQKGVDVVKEMTDICMEFDDSVFPMENLSIELNSYKFSQNASFSDCTTSATLAMLQKMDITPDLKDGKLVAILKSKLEGFWAALLRKMSVGIDEEIAILYGLEMAATGNTTALDRKSLDAISQKLQSGMTFRFVLQTMHDEEVLSEEAILKWAAERKEDETKESSSACVKLFQSQPIQDFLEWLEEESEDDDVNDADGSDDDSVMKHNID